MWNFYFEPGTDKLTQGGLSQLAYLARRRPQPDTMIYLQAAQDLSYDPAAPDRFAASRYDLDTKRIQAVQKFLNAQTAGRRQDFQVVVHDPAEVGASAAYANVAVGKMVGGATGVLSSSTGGGGGNTTGGAGASGGGSGGSGGGGSGGR
jgi:uncharacterized membrane protein YgcG